MTLLLKDPKSSCVIEGEKPPQDLIQRWDRVIGEAGWTPLDETVFLRLHRIVIGGMRADMVRNGSLCLVVMLTDETAFLPKAELHETLIREDIASLVHGLIAFDQASSIELDPVVAAAVLAFGFVYIHPLEDGNGRTRHDGFNPPASTFRFQSPS